MWNVLLWLYLANGTLLIVHEIDSAYWQEWRLFKIPGGITLFLALHVPLVFFLLLGAIWLDRQLAAGLVVSFILCGGGVFAFTIHNYFLKKGHPEFNLPLSKAVLTGTLVLSVLQFVASAWLWWG